MTVVVSGGSGAVTYQWQSSTDGINGWANATGTGATTNTYTPSSASAGTTYYRVLINAANSGCGQAVSNNGIAVITEDLLVTTQPSNVNECIGGADQMTVIVSGGSGAITYQWQSSADGINGWANATGAGATTTIYTPSSASAGTTYYRLLINAANNGCGQAISNLVTAVIEQDPSVYDSAEDNEICAGGNTILHSEVIGGVGISIYQWQQLVGGVWQDISGANSADYVTVVLDAGSYTYRVIVVQDSGCEGVSDEETIVVNDDPQVYDSAEDNEICSGGTTILHSEVIGGAGINMYQWQELIGGIWEDIPGANSADYITEMLNAGSYTYRVVVTQDAGCEAVSDEENIIVNDDPVVYDSAEDNEICEGGTTILHSEVIGGAGINSYQWQILVGGIWEDIPGANGADYITEMLAAGNYVYRVVVIQDAGCEAVSDEETIAVNSDPLVYDSAEDNEICAGGMTILHSEVIGGAGITTFQWQVLVGGNWEDIPGANNADYITDILDAGSYTYRIMAIQDSGCENASDGETVLVNDDPQVYDSAEDNEICAGGMTILHSEVIGGAGISIFQWQQLVSGNWVDIVGANGPDYITDLLDAGSYTYRVVAIQDSGCEGVSDEETIIVNEDPIVNISAEELQICAGGMTILHTEVIGGAGISSYQWQQWISGTWEDIISANGADYITDVLDAGTHTYRVLVVQDSGCDAASVEMSINVSPGISIETQPVDGVICQGGVWNLAAVATGFPNLLYQWQDSIALGQWQNVSETGGDTPAFTTDPLDETTYYRVIVSAVGNGCSDAISIFAQVDVVNDPLVVTSALDDIYCVGETVPLSVTVSGGTGVPHYQWQSFDGSNWTNEGPDASAYNVSGLTQGSHQYRTIVTQASGCESVSADLSFVVISYPTATLTSTPASCGDNEGTITITFSDNAEATSIMFSLDGGNTYFPSIPDDLGTTTFTNLAPATYVVWAKWATDECSIVIGTIQVNELGCGTICGEVTDDTGLPISNVQIRLYRDLNNNDVYDPGEPLRGTTYTDGDTGDYCFDDIPMGEYVVFEVQPANYNSVSDYDHTTNAPDTDGYAGANDPDNMIPVTLLPAESDMDNDFVEDPFLGSISGNVKDDGGTNLANMVIKLYFDTNNDGSPDGAPIATTTTDASGNYLFAGVEPLHYVVEEINLPLYADVSDYDQTTVSPDLDGNDSAQGPDGNIPVIVAPGEADNDNNFVDGRPGNICGNVSNDLGQPLSNVELRLYRDINNNDSLDAADIYLASTFTDGDSGDYCFEDVVASEYVVSEVQPANYNSISDYDHSINGSDPDGSPSGNDPDNEIAVTLLPNEQDNDNDFIEDPLVGTISGTVTNDVGAPINNVTISLYNDTNADGNPDGAALATTTTNISGTYIFTGVEPAHYVVVETTPLNHSNISDYDHTTTPPDTDGNDSAQGPDDNIPVMLVPGEADTDNDFEDGRPGTICGSVKDDTNQPLSGVQVKLYNDVNNNDSLDVADIVYQVTFTDGDTGDYCFEDVKPGEYVVVETQPANYNSVSDYDHTTSSPDTDGYASGNDPDNEIPVTLTPFEPDMDNDFIEDPFVGSISGNVVNDAGTPIAGVEIRLHNDTNADGNADGAAISTTFTNSSGDYIFTGVEPGYYVVIEITPLYYSSISDFDHSTASPDLDGNDSAQGPDDNVPVMLVPGEADADNDFVDGRPGMICGSVYDDTNLPISSVEIRLYRDINNNDVHDGADILAATTFTDGDTGGYCFEDVTPGEYVVFEVQPANYNSVSDYDHSTVAPDTDGNDSAQGPDDEIPVTLIPAEMDNDNDFIEDPFTGSIAGHVADDNGTSLTGIQIKLYNDTNADGNPDGAVLATTNTNGSGNYIFTGVEPGYYVVVEVSPLYYSNISDYDHTTVAPDLDGNDSAQGPDDNIPVFMLPGEADADNDFIDGRPGMICGNVSDDTGLYISNVEIRLYRDVNNNGIQDAGDILVATTFTDGDTGDYIFEDIMPANYVVVEIQPANYTSISDYDHSTTPPDTDGDDSADGPDNEIPVIVLPAENDCQNDFIEDPVPGTITGTVVTELNTPLAGVVLTLYHDTNADGNEDGAPIGTATTNVSGMYSFTGVEPGLYVVVETTPANYSNISDYDHSTTPPDTDGNDSAQGTDDDIPVKMVPGETDADNDFVDGTPGSICGSVKDDTGLPIANVQVKLYQDVNNNDSLDVADIQIAVVSSDPATGNYCFTNTLPGEYVIAEIQPANYYNVADYDISTGAFDNDGQPSLNDPDNEIAVTLEPSELDADNNFVEDPFLGNISGYVQNDINVPLPGTIIKLYYDTNGDGQEDGAAIATTSTDGSGYYIFTNLEPGLYVIVETSPFYYSNVSDYDHTTSAPDTDGDDTAQGPDDDIPVNLQPGESDTENIFMDGRPGMICGNVSDNIGQPISSVVVKLYLDVNNNDAYDAGDVLISTVLTDGDTGDYCFEDVTPAEYVVVETQPANYNSESDYDHSLVGDPDGDDQADGADDQIPVTLVPGEADNDNNFIDEPFVGSISGHVVDDIAAPIVGVKLYLYHDSNNDGNEDGTPLDSILTNVAGLYSFGGVIPGHYVVVEVNPLYYRSQADYDTSTPPTDTDGNDSAQGPDNDIPVFIMPAEADNDNDFVDGRPGGICGHVIDDMGNPMSNMEVQLYDDVDGDGIMDPEDIMVATVLTDGDTGGYCFEDVVPGMYILNEIQLPTYGDQSDVDDSPDPDGDDSSDGTDNNIPVEVTPAELDDDNNFVDIICPGAPTIIGFDIDTICSGGSVVLQATNQNMGILTYAWTFGSGSTPGSATGIGPHTVGYISNAGNSSTGAIVHLTISKNGCVPASDDVANIVVNPIPNADIDAATTNLCYFAPRTFKPVAAAVPGYSYLWNFGSGANFPTKTGYGPHTIEWSTTGVKTVQLIVYSNAAGSSCGDTSTMSFTVIQCLGNITGKVRKVDGSGIASVNVRLFPDVNLDGLSDGGSPIRSVFTTSTGVYSMASLPPGQYVLVETQPSGFTSVMDIDETDDLDSLVYFDPNDNILPVTVEPQEVDADNVFVENPTPGLITGSVFQDFDGDQVPDTGEGLPGVTIHLYTDTNTDGVADANGWVKDTVTNSIGFYALINVTPGNYVITETQPPGFLNVVDIDVTNDADLVPNTNTTDDIIPVSVANGETDANNYYIENIECTQVVTNINDSGPGSLRYVIECSDPGDTITFHSSLQNQVIHLTSDRITINKDLHIHSSLNAPRIMIYSDVQGVFVITAGHSVEMKNIEMTSGLGGVPGAGIENYGNLTIWDVCVFKNPLLTPGSYLTYNVSNAELNVIGACHISN